MYKYRITKYDPVFRDKDGIYQKDDWTSIDDIGKLFDGKKLTIKDYKKTEDDYIKAILLIMDYLKIHYLIVNDVVRSYSHENFNEIFDKYQELYTKEMFEYYLNVKKSDNLTKDNIDVCCRLLLREDIGASVFYPRKLKIYIGYDYLMGVHTSRPLDSLIPLIEGLGLYVENFSY